MQPLGVLVVVAASVFCAGLFAQESRPDTPPVSPANSASAPAPAPVSAPVTPVTPVATVPAVVLPSGPLSRAEMAATRWLAVIDAGDYPLSWRTLPFAPDGDYVLMEYETRFDFKPLATETLTTMKDRDNTWKVAGYFIK